eukprot:NODE_2904_length_1316_cov_173.860855_g2757_i0.p1 GENE.NODE_2904_length_1316_cov_173.860855_g2757_i0~~NODE_2904_length_1316_cov_173.860855_g2757_i0.p1  ORF type:complete len:414 (+),score=60.58 NODE_2904_length_1316_cov_173.860855_g2757_i0:66-1307(+)
MLMMVPLLVLASLFMLMLTVPRRDRRTSEMHAEMQQFRRSLANLTDTIKQAVEGLSSLNYTVQDTTDQVPNVRSPLAPSSVDETNQRPCAPTHRISIFIFTYNRLLGLERLFQSLVRSDYLGHVVDLTIFVDNIKKIVDQPHSTDHGNMEPISPIMEWIQSTGVWPHGALTVHKREKNTGLKRSIMEAWYPVNDHTFGAFFEDDTEVSPLWYKYVDRALREYYFVPTRDPRLVGLSLYRQLRDEVNFRDFAVNNSFQPFAFQQPCSWGAVYFPAPWRHFRDWFPTINYDPKVPWGAPSNYWYWWDSWKKYLIKLMWEHGLYMIYPNLPNRMVLSTNHLMKGMHKLPPRGLFELPLLSLEAYSDALRRGNDLLEVKVAEMYVLDMHLRRVRTPKELPHATSDYRPAQFAEAPIC